MIVESEFGCIDSLTQQLHVITRGEAPEIGSLGAICAGETTTFSARNTSLINVYSDVSLNNLIFTGEQFQSGPLEETTLFYVTNAATTVESGAVTVEVPVNIVSPVIEVLPDLSNLAQNAAVIQVEDPSLYNSINWEINGNFNSDQSSFSQILADGEESFNISLQVLDTMGCMGASSLSLSPSKSVRPFFPNQIVCSGEEVLITPENGNVFSFFANETDLEAIHKGQEFLFTNIDNDTAIYVRGIDSLLESDAVRIDFIIEEFIVDINASTFDLELEENTLAREVSLSAEGDGILDYEWFIDDVLVESIPMPVLFFDEPGEFEIKLIATNENGCRAEAIQFVRVTFPSVVTSTIDGFNETFLWPNPSNGIVFLPENLEFVAIHSISGNILDISPSDDHSIDLSQLDDGIYFAVFLTKEHTTQVEKIVLRK